MASKKKKKKNMITLLSLFIVLVLLIVVYFAASKWKEAPEEEADEPESGILLASVKTEEIAEIRVANDLYSYTVAAENNQWVMKGDEEFPLAAERIGTMADQLADFQASRLVLAGAPDLEEYGLASPVLSVEVAKKDGEEISLHIGDHSSADGGYYACVGTSTDVYLITAAVRDIFYLSQETLMSFDTVPAFTSDAAAGLKVVSSEYPSFTIKDSTNDLRDLTAMALYTLALYDIYEKPVRVDLTNFAALMENYTTIDLGAFTAYHAADAAAYGLSSPATALTVWYEEGETGSEQTKEFTLYFGNRTEDESGIYVRLEGSNQIFTMSAETAQALLAPDVFSALSRYTQMVNITTVGCLKVGYGGTERIFAMTHESQTQENGGVSTTDYFTVDGKALDEGDESDAFRDLYQAIIALRITAELPEDAVLETDAVLSLTFLENDSEEVMHEVRYLPIAGDAEHYAIEENGLCLFVADAAQVDEVIEEIKAYQP